MLAKTLLSMLLLVGLTTVALAQPEMVPPPEGGGEVKPQPPIMQPRQVYLPPMNAQNSVVEITAKGFFVVYAGMIAKYDPATMKPAGTLRLLEPLPPQPAMYLPRFQQPMPPIPQLDVEKQERKNLEANRVVVPVEKDPKAVGDEQRIQMQKWQEAYARYTTPPVMMTTDDALLILLADRFFRIDQATLKVVCEATLPAQAGNGQGRAFYGNASIVKQQNDTLFIIRNGTITSLDAKSGKIIGAGALPAEMLTGQQGGGIVAMPMPMPILLEDRAVGLLNHVDILVEN